MRLSRRYKPGAGDESCRGSSHGAASAARTAGRQHSGDETGTASPTRVHTGISPPIPGNTQERRSRA